MSLTLRTVTRTQGNNAALKDGTVTPAGCVFAFEEVPVLVQAFRRMVRSLEFDVCEMALTTYLSAKAHGVAFTAVPVFLVRGFHHAAMVRHSGGPVRGPADVVGQRVGVYRGYTVTTGVWARGILQDEYGVDLDKVTWLPSGDEHVADYRPPRNVELLPSGLSLEDAVAGGVLPAAVGLAFSAPNVAPLIEDPEEAAYASLRARRFYPINHTVVVRDEILAEHPDVAVCVFEAFAAAKRRYVDRLRAGDIREPTASDQMYQRVMEVTGEDPLPYGIGPNREMLEMLVRYAVDQHILAAPVDVPSVFAAPTRELVA